LKRLHFEFFLLLQKVKRSRVRRVHLSFPQDGL
jgi:hypothetical protein